MSGIASRPLPTGGPTAGGEDIDDLFGGLDDEDDPFSDNYVTNAAKERMRKEEAAKKERTAADELDAEVKIKPRVPRVKLDEDRLLSANGIPKLRNKAKHHLKFKGKGHEYSDVTRLLSFYQLWLDDLFPKAKFLDALAMVEKMGHKKRMQMMRMEWINEGKPKPDNDDLFDEPTIPPRQKEVAEKDVPLAPIFEKRASERPKTPAANGDVDMDDIYDATPRPRQTQGEGISQTDSLFGGAAAGGAPSLFGNAKVAADDVPEEDDLDALMAEEEMLQALSANAQPVVNTSKAPVVLDGFDDDEEAMAEMDGMW